MTLVKITPFSTAPVTSGFRIALGESKAGQYIQFTITETAQKEHFGKALNGHDEVKIMIDNAAGRNHLMGLELAKAGEGLPVTLGVKGSVRIKVTPWRQVPAGKLPITSMPVVANQDRATLVKLPAWAQPTAVKASS